MTRERFCECGEIFDAVDDGDQLCKRCLLKRYRELVRNGKEIQS